MRPIMLLVFALLTTSSLLVARPYEKVADKCSLSILTPSLKKRKTAKIRLRNGLEAYLVSDPSANQSAAALSVETGSWADPKDLPGIAHFTEHLLFMGSKKYPAENAYERLVSEHGGRLNAFTASDATVYSFSINHDAFATALDCFSHMFIDPLFQASSVGRELHAIEQEHALTLEHDCYRIRAVEKATGNPNHPEATFNCGNLASLKDIPREEVIKWWRKNYSSDKAHLVLYSSLPIAKLKALAADLFSAMPTKKSPPIRFEQAISSSEQRGSLITVEPIQHTHRLIIRWELPRQEVADLDNTAADLVAFALRSQHENGLYDQLKKASLIEYLYANVDHYSKENAFFSLSIQLTPKGVAQIDTIIDKCYQAIHLLKASSVPHHLFDEYKAIATLDYAYQSQCDPFQYATMTAYELTQEPLETFPEKITIPTTFNPHNNAVFLSHLTPESAIYLLIAPSKLTQTMPDRKEKWYGVDYAVHTIEPAKLEAWKAATPNEQLTLRVSNTFIPKNLALVTSARKLKTMPMPTKLIDDTSALVYFWGDTHYRVPKINWNFRVKTAAYDDSIKSAVLGDLFCKALDDLFPLLFAYASPAGLHLNYTFEKLNFVLTLRGYSEQASTMLTQVLDTLTSVQLTCDQFEHIQNCLDIDYANFNKRMPFVQMMEVAEDLLLNDRHRTPEKRAILKTITCEDLNLFAKSLFEKTAIQALLTGNLTQAEAEQVWQQVKPKLHPTPLASSECHQRRILTLPDHKGPHKIEETTNSLGNAAVLIVQHGSSSFEKRAAAGVLQAALSQDFFDTLRTKQQTAYLTRFFTQEIENQLDTLLAVQSSTHEPGELIARFELFLENYVKDFKEAFPEERFQEIKSSLITKWGKLPPSLNEMSHQLEAFAFTYNEDFAHREKKIKALKALTYENIKVHAKNFFSRQDNPKRVAILLTSTVPTEETFRYTNTTAEELKSYCLPLAEKESESSKKQSNQQESNQAVNVSYFLPKE
ncbi:MAG: insulinase family protein [Chlamydiota bacterium]